MTTLRVRLLHGFAAGAGALAGVGLDQPENPRELLKQSGVRHAGAYGVQVALLALAARRAIVAESPKPNPRRAVITNGGPWAAEPALGFLQTARERGPQFVNPLVFPATLVSAGAAATAVVVGAGAAAIAVGHDELAFFEMLRRARQLIQHAVADEVLVVAACASSPALRVTLAAAGRDAPVADCSIAFKLTSNASNGMMFEDAIVGSDASPWPDVRLRLEAQVGNDGLVEAGQLWPCPNHQLLSAVGAVLCQVGLNALAAQAHADEAVVVSCRKGGQTGAAKFRRT